MTKQISIQKAMAKITPALTKLQKKYDDGDKWSKAAIQPDLDKLNNKIAELKQLNENYLNSQKQAQMMNQFMPMAEGGGEVDDITQDAAETKKVLEYNSRVRSLQAEQQMRQQAQAEYMKNLLLQGAMQGAQQGAGELPQPQQEQLNSTFQPLQVPQGGVMMEDGGNPFANYIPRQEVIGNSNTPMGRTDFQQFTENTDWGNVASQGAQLAPAAFNLMKGLQKPEEANLFLNPNRDESTELYRDSINRDISASLADNRESYQNTIQNARTGAGGNAASYMGFANQADRVRSQRDYQLRQWKENQEAAAKARAGQGIFGMARHDAHSKNRK